MVLRCLFSWALASALFGNVVYADSQDIEHVATIAKVRPDGNGLALAADSLRALRGTDTEIMPTILRAFNDATPVGRNYLRNAFETLAEREVAAGRPLPRKALLEFVGDTGQSARARRLAYEWLLKQDQSLAEELLPGMITDPSPELRRDAVARLIANARRLEEGSRTDEARRQYLKALTGAVDPDQVEAVVEPLKQLGVEIDLQKHFGFLTAWHIVGPFDNRDEKGFAIAYGPESNIDLSEKLNGQSGEVEWQKIQTDDGYGLINIAEQIENYKGSCMYAVTTFDSLKAIDVQLRLGTPNAWKLWVNDELVFAREEYHRVPSGKNSGIDSYRQPVRLKAGRNRILLKVCQNEQTQDWAQRYEFRLRVCDAAGSGIVSSEANTVSELRR